MKQLFFFVTVVIGVTAARMAGASSEAGGHGGADLKFIFSVINFILFLILLYVLALPKAKNFFVDRSKKIRQALEEALKAKTLAEQKLGEYQAKLNALDREVQEIKAAVQQEGEAEKARIITDAEKDAESIKKQAHIIAEHEVQKAKAELQREVARLSLERAEKLIREKINADDQIRLVKDYINNIER